MYIYIYSCIYIYSLIYLVVSSTTYYDCCYHNHCQQYDDYTVVINIITIIVMRTIQFSSSIPFFLVVSLS